MKKINDSSFIEDLGILSLTYFMTGVQNLDYKPMETLMQF